MCYRYKSKWWIDKGNNKRMLIFRKLSKRWKYNTDKYEQGRMRRIINEEHKVK